MLVTDVKIRFLCRRLSFLPQDNFSTAHHSLLAKENWKILQNGTGKYCKRDWDILIKGLKNIAKELENIAKGTGNIAKGDWKILQN